MIRKLSKIIGDYYQKAPWKNKTKQNSRYDLRVEKALCVLGAGKARGKSKESVKTREDKETPLRRCH